VSGLSIALTGGRSACLGKIPDDGEHKIPFDRAIGVLRDKAAADIPVKSVVLVEQVVDRGLEQQLVIFQQLFP
jgi:hypothetical protein